MEQLLKIIIGACLWLAGLFIFGKCHNLIKGGDSKKPHL